MPPHSDPTLAYYDAHADEYAAVTTNKDLSALYEPFLALVPPGGHILDAGCGSGRDARMFHRRGFQVTAFDGSPAMALVAQQLTGLPVQVLRFEDVAFGPEFDGVWACASLLHVPRADLAAVLGRMVGALKQGGVLFASVKLGEGEGERDGRWFTDYTEAAFGQKLSDQPGLETIRVWVTADMRQERKGVNWVYALARKRFV